MKRTILACFTLVVYMFLTSASDTPQQKYIDRWAATAVREMYRSGVPASITLAQGILESRSGQSSLAADGNNHFGIKCHNDWKGRSMKLDDDAKDECFRVYDDADESFRDHSDFLRYRDRYKFLFDFDTKDYESWAYGLKKAGYATDPSYPAKLIKIIEDYDLSKYDSMTQAQAGKEAAKVERSEILAEKEDIQAEPAEPSDRQDQSRKVREKKTREKKSHKHDEEVIPDIIPESPHSIEESRPVAREAAEEFHFSLSRQIYVQNGVPFVYSVEGETYSSIASSNNLFPKEILKINDLSANEKLLPGTVVYLQQKKNQAEKGLDKYIVENDGESLRELCQRYAVRMKSVCKMNGFAESHVLREGETVILRK